MQKSPNYITKLQPDEIFVFGSNLAGMHSWLLQGKKICHRSLLRFRAETLATLRLDL